jgi:hypothetical protein
MSREEDIMRKYAISLIIALCAAFAPKAAEAQPVPPICDTAREVRQFLVGVRAGRSLAKQAIARVLEESAEPNICDDLEAVADLQALIEGIVDDLTDIPPSELAACRLQGQIVGLIAEVSDLQDTCEDTCIADGQFIGEISAQLYCALSIALDGLGLADLFERLATTVCGELFEDACDAEFFSTATSDVECAPFTVDPFDDVFHVAQNNQCASNPAP